MTNCLNQVQSLDQLIQTMSPFLDNLQQPVAIIDTDGRYVYYNQESADMDGCSIAYALGKKLTDVYLKLRPENSTMLKALTGTVFVNHRQNYFNSKGKLVNYAHTTTPLKNELGQIIGAIEMGWDISHEGKLQREILALNRKLAEFKGTKSPKRTKAEDNIVTRSPKVHALIDKAKKYAESNVPVVIYGESGTGKELFATLIYENSARSDGPFVVLNCGALSETLIEPTLFGTVKGAYTGAENSEGLLASANGGTLFLDEFNSMSMAMQVKLLRFLQQKTYTRVGDHRLQKSDARIIVAMNERPDKLIREGRLRSDLFWRLCVAYLELPSLKERMQDIPLLARHFVRKYSDDVPANITGISDAAIASLMIDWPGNIRMLENVIVRSMVLQETDGPLEKIVFEYEWTLDEHTPQAEQPFDQSGAHETILAQSHAENHGSLTERLEAFEKRLIVEAINASHGNVSAASSLLGVNRTTLNYKVKKYHLSIGVVSPDS